MNEDQMMHGTDWSGENLAGFVLSEKFEGCRAYWDGQQLWTRGGKIAKIPAEWAATLPNMPLDCELYDGTDGVYRCTSALRYGKFTPSMQLVVFDAPTAQGDYIERVRAAESAIAGVACAVAVSLSVCRDNDHALELMREIQQRGGEGVMAINPQTPYLPGRTNRLLKVKYEPI